MPFFSYKEGVLHAEAVPVTDIAEQFGTPTYVYSRAAIEHAWSELDQAFSDYPHLICYAVKANSNLGVLNILARLGSGFDIVSAGELKRVILAGGDPAKVVFSGVAKTHQELEFVIQTGIRSINVESEAELQRIQAVAKQLNRSAPISLRVNPDVDAKTHPYISTGLEEAKFGVSMDQAVSLYQQACEYSHIDVHGIACHIGSQITDTLPFTDALRRVLEKVQELENAGVNIDHLDLGGGLGIRYQDETPPSAQEYIESMLACLAEFGIQKPVAIEPGRFITGNAGILLSKVEYLKHNRKKSFAIVDAGMNDLLRPSLYQAWHDIIAVSMNSTSSTHTVDVVGPVCETGDVLGYARELDIAEGDLVAVRSAGAYGFVMASNYNSRTRPAEVMVDGEHIHIVRSRETIEDLTRGEAVLP